MSPRPLWPTTLKLAVLLPVVLATWACAGGESEEEAPAVEAAGDIRVTGFSTPESVLHDTVADVYLVSNISGAPLDKDDDGFISRVDPDGQILELRWIDGAAGDFTLNAPKGLAISGNTLYVADIDCVRLFDRETGAHRKDVCLEDATFLNDVAAAPDGSIFFTDSGLKAGDGGFAPSGSDAVYRLIDDERVVAVKKAPALGAPNGLTVGPRGILVVTFSTGEVYRLDAEGNRTDVLPPSARQLDGIVTLPDGGFLMSSWGDSCVYRIGADGSVTKVVEDAEAPADIGYDAGRNRVLVPLFNAGEVLIHPLG